MKKHLLLFTMLLFLSNSLFAQVYFGPKLGFSSSKWKKEYTDFSQTAVGGFHGGLALGLTINEQLMPFYPMQNPISLQAELYYESRGIDYSHNDADYAFKLAANYITLPIMVKLSFETVENLYINIMGGCYSSFWTSGTWTHPEEITELNPLPLHWTFEDEIDFDDRFQQRWEWGLNAGAEIEYKFENFSVYIAGRQNWSMNSAFNEVDDARYRVFQFTAGLYYFF